MLPNKENIYKTLENHVIPYPNQKKTRIAKRFSSVFSRSCTLDTAPLKVKGCRVLTVTASPWRLTMLVPATMSLSARPVRSTQTSWRYVSDIRTNTHTRIYIYICVYIYDRIYNYKKKPTCTIWIKNITYIHTCIHMMSYVYIYIYMHMHDACIYTYICINIYIYMGMICWNTVHVCYISFYLCVLIYFCGPC